MNYNITINVNYSTNTSFCEPTDEEWEIYLTVCWWFQGLVAIVFCSIGFMFNSAAQIILSIAKTNDSNSAAFNRQLVCLTLFDNLYLFIGISEAIRNHFADPNYFHDYAFTVFLYPLRSISMFCSMYATIILSLVRYNSIKNPIAYLAQARLEISSSFCRDIRYIIFVVFTAFLFYMPKFFEFEIQQSCENEKNSSNSDNVSNCTYIDYFISDKYLRRDKHYVLWYMNVLNIIFTVIVPFVLLFYLNWEIYWGMQRFRKRQRLIHQKRNSSNLTRNSATSVIKGDNIEQATIIFSLVVIFFCGHILRAILNIQEAINYDWTMKELERGCHGVMFWAMILVPLSEFMLLFNSSANFFIYYVFHKDFRNILRHKYEETRSQILTKLNSSERLPSKAKNEAQEPFPAQSSLDICTNQLRTENIEMNELI